jgi:TolB-like protein
MSRETRVRAGVLAVSLFVCAFARAQSRPQIAVMDLEAKNVDKVLADSATDVVTNGLRELRVFRVISRSEIKQMLTIDRERQSVASGCSESSCLTEIGSALGARYLIVGSITGINKEKGPYTLRVQLFDMNKAVVASEQLRQDLKSGKEVVDAAPNVAVAVVRPILDKEQGFLELVARENGCNVTIDGRLVGVTPLRVTSLGWGPHRVVVEKTGFIAWAKDVQVEKNQATTEAVSLIPSPDFIDGYKARNRILRYGAYGTTVLAAAGFAAAAYLQFAKIDPTFERFKDLGAAWNAPDKSGILEGACTTAFNRDASAKGNPGPPTADIKSSMDACYRYADSLAKAGAGHVTNARIATGVGVASAVGATYLWLSGEDPGRYDAFIGSGSEPAKAAPADKPTEKPSDKAATPSPKATVFPIQGGGVAALVFAF